MTFLALLPLFLLCKSVHSNGESDVEGSTLKIPALITAAGEGDFKRVEYLLDTLKVDVNELSPDGESALHVAAIKGNPETARLLLSHGAIVDSRSPSGKQRSMTPLHWATYGGHVEMVKILLQYGADPHLKDETGLTAVDMSIESAHENVLRVFEGGGEEEL